MKMARKPWMWPPIGGMNHEFTVQIFEIQVFTHKFFGTHVHVNLICVQNLGMGEKVGKFLSLTVWWLNKVRLATVSTVSVVPLMAPP